MQAQEVEIGGRSMMSADRRNDDQLEQPLHQLQLPLQLHLKLRPLPLPLPPPPPPPPTPTQTQSNNNGKSQEASNSIEDYALISTPPTTSSTSRKATRSIASTSDLNDVSNNNLVAIQAEQGRDSVTWREAKRVLLLNSNPTVAQRLDKRTLQQQQQPHKMPTSSANNINKNNNKWLPTTDSMALETQPIVSRVNAAIPQQQQQQLMHQLASSNSIQREKHQQQQVELQKQQQVTTATSTINRLNDNNLATQRNRLETLSAALMPLIWPLSNLQDQNRASADASKPQILAAGSQISQSVHSDKLEKLVALNLTPPSDARQPRRKRKKTSPAYLQQVSSSTTPYPDSFRMASKYPMPKIKFQQQHNLHNNNNKQQQHSNQIAANQVQLNSARAITSKRLVAKQQQQLQHQKNKNAKSKKKVNYQPFEHSSPQQQQQSDNANIAVQNSSWQSMSLSALPKGLSKLIEDKLFQNVSNYLMHKIASSAQSQNNHNATTPMKLNGNLNEKQIVKLNAPTTSVSRVVNVIGSARKIVGASRELNEAAKAQSPERLAEAALQIANAASDAWRQSNLTLEDLRLTFNPTTTTTTTPKPVSINQTEIPLAKVDLSPTNQTSNTNDVANSTELSQNSISSNLNEQITTTTLKPAILHQSDGKLMQVQAGVQYENQDQESMASKQIVRPVTSSQPQSQLNSDFEGITEKSLNVNQKKIYKRRENLEPKNRNNQQEEKREKHSHFNGNRRENSNNNGNSNIKLFHFNRKPDVNKLPFYKKPLNYTELGWTSEQIQEHLELLASLGLPTTTNANEQTASPMNLGAPSTIAESDLNSDGSDKSPRQQQQNGLDAKSDEIEPEESQKELQQKDQQQQDLEQLLVRERVDLQQDKFHLLKRKRRGGRTSQFDKLMADLHSNSNLQQQQASIDPYQNIAYANINNQEVNEQQQLIKSNELVPTLRKKDQLLVMKPIFMHAMLNQSRTTTTTSTTQKPDFQQNEREMHSSSMINGSKPIIRMRRKNGLHDSSKLQESGWKPMSTGSSTGKVPSAALSAVSLSEQLMLVPSGLLTPSGSHLIPLIAKAPSNIEMNIEQNDKLLSQFFAWKPARQQRNEQQMQTAGSTMLELDIPAALINPQTDLTPTPTPTPMPSAPSSTTNNQQQQQQTIQSQLVAKTAAVNGDLQQNQNLKPIGEFRVPKLLVKPMRPAKYSLNGYIPKPSLTQSASSPMTTSTNSNSNGDFSQNNPSNQQQQQQQQQQSTQTALKLQPLNPNWTTTNHSKQQQQQQQQQHNNYNSNSRDLDSSTSNEIFSRRRGLNANSMDQASALQANNNQVNRAKLEENKRKYLLLSSQQESKNKRSPTLSAHKANLIRAKLGLIPKQTPLQAPLQTNSANTPINDSESPNEQAGQASTNSIAHLNPRLQQQQFSGNRHSGQRQLNGASSSGQSDENNAIVNKQLDEQIALAGASANSASGIPKTDFECTDKSGKFVSGLFADYKTKCQVWHLCSNNRKYSFLCPAGTVFNAKTRICDWRYNVKCDAESTLPQ